MNKKKQSLYCIAAASFFFVSAANCFAADYLTTDQVIKSDQKKQSDADMAIIGKQYWFSPTGNTSLLDSIFYSSLQTEFNIQIPHGSFQPSTVARFTVVNLIRDPGIPTIVSYYVIKFDDGKAAFIRKSDFDIDFNADPTEDELKDHWKPLITSRDPAYLSALALAKRTVREHAEEKRLAEQAAVAKARGGVRIGMTKKQVLKSNWGHPDSINKTITRYGVREQWVYGDQEYLYFENGRLTAIQN